MKKLTVKEYSDLKGVSVQAIYGRIKRKSLETVTENDVIYVLAPEKEHDQKSDNKANEPSQYIQILEAQLREKDNQIREKDEQLRKRDDQISSFIEQQRNSQIMLAGYQQKQGLLEANPDNEPIIVEEPQKK